MRGIYKILELWPPLERVEGKGILQRRCHYCDRLKFCKLFKLSEEEEEAQVEGGTTH